MPNADVTIINKLGLHARASAKLTQLAAQFAADIWLSRGERRVNAKSIMGIMMLAASQGTTITVATEGADADLALAQVIALIHDRFGEDE
jgi:phosphocarrier protein